jgi:hypothetical protein
VGAVAGDREERNRVFGVPIGPAPGAGPLRESQRPQWEPQPGQRKPQPGQRKPRRESQRVLGFPVDWFGPGKHDVLDALRHPVRAFLRWRQRRAEGP